MAINRVFFSFLFLLLLFSLINIFSKPPFPGHFLSAPFSASSSLHLHSFVTFLCSFLQLQLLSTLIYFLPLLPLLYLYFPLFLLHLHLCTLIFLPSLVSFSSSSFLRFLIFLNPYRLPSSVPSSLHLHFPVTLLHSFLISSVSIAYPHFLSPPFYIPSRSPIPHSLPSLSFRPL